MADSRTSTADTFLLDTRRADAEVESSRPGGVPRGTADRAAHEGGWTDRATLETLWQDNRRWVAAIILAYKPKWADVEDLLQEVAASLIAHGHELRDVAAARAWLRQVAINAARLEGRKGKLRQHGSLDTHIEVRGEAPAAPERVPADTRESERLLELASRLPDGYREPLILKAVHDLSYRQISQILDLPETTIETRIARARRQLRELAQADAGATPAV
ncbi:MAG: sigma-70 family RNA polymerase sigma factor [Planctomycetota bacterium]|nr:sigma-70 family RNA polymerase sigma factor [Planctomycetota bacterium]